MGIMICKTHGRVGFVETCSHVAKQINDRKLPDGRRFTIFIGNFFICDVCYNSLEFERFISLANLPIEEVIMVEDGRFQAFEAAYNALEGRRLFCLKCVAELERQYSSV
jgi:hypothetical protein